MTHDGRRRAILAIDTATTHVVIATGTPEGVADGLSTLDRRVSPRRDPVAHDRAVPRGAEHPAVAPRRDRRRDGSWRVHRAAGGHRDGQGPGPRARHPARRGFDGRGADRGVRGGGGSRGCGGGPRRPGRSQRPAAARRPARPSRGPCRFRARAAARRGGAGPRPWGAARGRGPRGARPGRCDRPRRDGAVGPWSGAPASRGSQAGRDLGRGLRSRRRAADGPRSELETLVPDYVTLPRGVRATGGAVEWSRDPR